MRPRSREPRPGSGAPLFWVLIVVAVCASLCGRAEANDWSREDTAREAAYLLLHAVDWGQTRHVAKHPERFREVNPLLGEHPSTNRVRNYMFASAVLHAAASRVLPPPWRARWQRLTLALKIFVVGYNFGAGVRVDF